MNYKLVKAYTRGNGSDTVQLPFSVTNKRLVFCSLSAFCIAIRSCVKLSSLHAQSDGRHSSNESAGCLQPFRNVQLRVHTSKNRPQGCIEAKLPAVSATPFHPSQEWNQLHLSQTRRPAVQPSFTARIYFFSLPVGS